MVHGVKDENPTFDIYNNAPGKECVAGHTPFQVPKKTGYDDQFSVHTDKSKRQVHIRARAVLTGSLKDPVSIEAQPHTVK